MSSAVALLRIVLQCLCHTAVYLKKALNTVIRAHMHKISHIFVTGLSFVNWPCQVRPVGQYLLDWHLFDGCASVCVHLYRLVTSNVWIEAQGKHTTRLFGNSLHSQNI